jgi:hypothetical protein
LRHSLIEGVKEFWVFFIALVGFAVILAAGGVPGFESEAAKLFGSEMFQFGFNLLKAHGVKVQRWGTMSNRGRWAPR